MNPHQVVYRRTDLYVQVWAAPMLEVAKKYDVSDVALAKTCKKLGVPVPGRGHWARVAAGRAIKTPPLPPRAKDVPEEIHVWRRASRKAAQAIRSEVREQADAERQPEASIAVAESLDKPHPLVASAAKLLRKAKVGDDGRVACRSEPCLDIVVSPALLERALRIMDALVKALAARKMTVEAPLLDVNAARAKMRVRVENVFVTFRLTEPCRMMRIPPPAKPRFAWLDRATIQYVPTGILELAIDEFRMSGERKTWRDGTTRKLEACLNEFVAQLHVAAASAKRWEEERAEEQWRWEEQARRRREAEERAKEEQRKAAELTALVGRWRLADDIRAFVADAQLRGDRGHPVDWSWALGYADRVDPLGPTRQNGGIDCGET